MRIHHHRVAALTGLAVLLLPALAFAAGGDGAGFEEARQHGLLAAYLASFGAGFVTSLTPCVYPMIPIVLGIFGARGKNVSRGKAVTLASLYVFGMGITYAFLGCVFAMLGKQFGTLLAEPGFVIPIVLLYVALAISMFGAFELNLPASWQAKLSTVGGSGYGGAFAMGLVGGFTAAPCTGPFLGGILGFVTATHDIPLGGSLLFVYALGMGVLFFALAAFAIALPKSGRWMEWMKSIGGIALLAVAIYFLRPIIPALNEFGEHTSTFLAIGVVATVVGLALGAVHLSFHDRRAIKARKGVAVFACVAGLSVIVAWQQSAPRYLPWVMGDENAAFAAAKQGHKGVMVDFGASWCQACKKLETTFAADGVYEGIVADFVPLKLDVSDDNEQNDALRARYGAKTLPAVIFLDAEHAELGRVVEEVGASGFREVLDPAAAAIEKHRGAISSR